MSKHTCGGPVFGKLAQVGQCARCDELRAGAPAVQWRGNRNAQIEAQRVRAIRAHDCKRSGCLPICTFGDA